MGRLSLGMLVLYDQCRREKLDEVMKDRDGGLRVRKDSNSATTVPWSLLRIKTAFASSTLTMGLELLILIPSLIITLAIVVPLTGVLIRYRANYNPKSLQLDAEGGAQAHTGAPCAASVSLVLNVC